MDDDHQLILSFFFLFLFYHNWKETAVMKKVRNPVFDISWGWFLLLLFFSFFLGNRTKQLSRLPVAMIAQNTVRINDSTTLWLQSVGGNL